MSVLSSLSGSTDTTAGQIGAGLQAAGSGALGALGNQPTITDKSGSGTSSTSSAGTSSSTTAKTLTPYQSAIQGPLFNYISQLMTDPTATVAPYLNQAENQVNSNYSGLADSLRQQFLGNGGGGASGKFGMALAQGNLNRLSDLSNTQTQFAQTAATLPLTAEQLGQNLLGMNMGSTTSGGTSGNSGTNSSSTSQESTQTGNSLTSGLGGLISGMMSLF